MTTPTPDPIPTNDRAYLEARRRALIQQLQGVDIQRQGFLAELGAIEQRLGLERTREPKHARERRAWQQRRGEEEGYEQG